MGGRRGRLRSSASVPLLAVVALAVGVLVPHCLCAPEQEDTTIFQHNRLMLEWSESVERHKRLMNSVCQGGEAAGDGGPHVQYLRSPSRTTSKETVVGDLAVGLHPVLQTIMSLRQANCTDNFSFVPTDGRVDRSSARVHALGDITLRVRPRPLVLLPPQPGLSEFPAWTTITTAAGDASSPVRPILPTPPGELAAADITPALGPLYSPNFPLVIERHYAKATDSAGGLLMWFTILNNSTGGGMDVEIGGAGASMVFENWVNGRTLADMASTCSFIDPYVGGGGGYVSVTRMTGAGPTLMVLPENNTRLEAWRTIREDLAPCCIMGTSEWTALAGAWASQEWAGSGKQWAVPSVAMIAPGEKAVFGFRFLLVPSLRRRDQALADAGRPVAIGIPGYVISREMSSAKLMVLPPADATLVGTVVDPPSAMMAKAAEMASPGSRWMSVPVQGVGYGQCHVTLHFSNGVEQIVHYFVLPPLHGHLARFGAFQASTAWLPRASSDPFGRGASVMPWDRERGRHVMHDTRAFVVGLSDEAGAGANVGLAMKVAYVPVQSEVAIVDEYINSTLWGIKPELPFPVSLQDHDTHGIRASLFWVPTPGTSEPGMPGYRYEPMDTMGWIWNHDRAVRSLGRAYNYPHQVAVYHSMYRALRNNDKLKASRPALWYLQKAALTTKGMWRQALWYCQMGLMVGSVFRDVIDSLRSEGLTLPAAEIEAMMFQRTAVGIDFPSGGPCQEPGPCPGVNVTGDKRYPPGTQCLYKCPSWLNASFPYGSEFAWDSTGQEEIYVWAAYFGLPLLAGRALEHILAFMPAVPSWAYHGSALSMGDFSNNAKHTPFGGWERAGHHYRAGLNAIPILEAYHHNPDDFYLLQVGIGGSTGLLTNIEPGGAASMGFHLDPSMLQFDPYSGDYGIGFFGHAQLACSYLINHTEWGWLCFMCDHELRPSQPSVVSVLPRDSFRVRAFLEPLGVLLVAEAGTFREVVVDFSTRRITVRLEPTSGDLFSRFRLKAEVTIDSRAAQSVSLLQPATHAVVRGAFEFDPSDSQATAGTEAKLSWEPRSAHTLQE